MKMNEKMQELETIFDKMVEDASDGARSLFEEERRQRQVMETGPELHLTLRVPTT